MHINFSYSLHGSYHSNSVVYETSGGSRIFLKGAPTSKMGLSFKLFAENCMKIKEFGPPLDPPMETKKNTMS